MNNFQHAAVKEINLEKIFGDSFSVLSQIPAHHPADAKALVISFNTVSTIKGQREDAPFVDEEGNDVDGVDVGTPMGTLYTAKTSLEGLARLSHDKRVLLFTVYKFNGC